jgi:phosphate transport system substrate-binding protein
VKVQRYGRLAALIAASSLALTACGSSDADQPSAAGGDTPSLRGTLNGGGSSAQESAMEAWRAGFAEAHPDVTVNYDPVGSSGGREQFLSGGLAFAGSDGALKDAEIAAGKTRCPGGDAIEFPLYISPVAVLYNLEGVEELNLSAPVIADIFTQKIKKWNDPALAALNEGVTLPDLAITPVNRGDGSGTTENFTDYLAEAAGAKWPYEADSDFPVSGGEAANGTSGVVAAVKGGNGTIGYADASRAEGLGVARIGVGDEFVAPTPEGASKLVESAERVSGRPAGDITVTLPRTTTDPTTYPISLVAYSIVCTSYQDAAQGQLVKAFFSYVASEQGQAAAAENAGSAPISDALRADVLTAVEAIKAGA